MDTRGEKIIRSPGLYNYVYHCQSVTWLSTWPTSESFHWTLTPRRPSRPSLVRSLWAVPLRDTSANWRRCFGHVTGRGETRSSLIRPGMSVRSWRTAESLRVDETGETFVCGMDGLERRYSRWLPHRSDPAVVRQRDTTLSRQCRSTDNGTQT